MWARRYILLCIFVFFPLIGLELGVPKNSACDQNGARLADSAHAFIAASWLVCWSAMHARLGLYMLVPQRAMRWIPTSSTAVLVVSAVFCGLVVPPSSAFSYYVPRFVPLSGSAPWYAGDALHAHAHL